MCNVTSRTTEYHHVRPLTSKGSGSDTSSAPWSRGPRGTARKRSLPLEDAVAAWLEVAREALVLDPVPAVLDIRLREVALELTECGHGPVLRPVLDELARRTRE